jgi:tetratricopeptide (TPR) repeat protein
LNPTYAEAYYNRGIAWADKGDYDRGIADYTRAIELNPKAEWIKKRF